MDYDTLAKKYFGDNYKDMTPRERLLKAIEHTPLDYVQRQLSETAASLIPEEKADDITLKFLESFEAFGELAKKLSDVKADKKK